MFKKKPQSKKIPKTQPSTQHDELLKRKFPLSWLLSVLLFIVVLFFIMLSVFYVAAGTERGTQFFLDKIDSETGIHLNYQEGNLRDGLQVNDIEFDATDTVKVSVDRATVKLGWRAIFIKQLHLRYADIGHIDIVDSKPPSGNPFDYRTLKLPVNALIDKANIDKISYRQNSKQDIVLNDIVANNVSWVGSKITLKKGVISYSDYMHFKEVRGYIDLQDNYPLNASAELTIDALKKAYISPLQLTASGSLQQAHVKAKAQYNGYPIHALVDAQPLKSQVPFNAQLFWHKVQLPYLTEEKIKLSEGSATFKGDINDIDMRINTSLTAKSIIPNGQYQGRANIYPLKGLDIKQMDVESKNGLLSLVGSLDWQQDFTSKLTIHSNEYWLEDIIPKDFKDYQPYAPEQLQGQLNFDYRYKNDNNNQQYDFKLAQANGELVDFQLIMGKTPQAKDTPRTWTINANWKDYYREDIPNIGIIDTESGRANVIIQGSTIKVDGNAVLEKLVTAPAGNYDVNFVYKPNHIDINKLIYAGLAGQLTGSGQLSLPTDDTPFSWDISADTTQFLVSKILQNSPIVEVSGTAKSTGSMTQIKDGIDYSIDFNDATLSALLSADLESRLVDVTEANGFAKITFQEGMLTSFDVDFDGGANITNLPVGHWQAKVSGNPNNFVFKQLNYNGDIGGFNGSLAIDLGDDTHKKINWDVNGTLDALDLEYFAPSLPVIATGNLQTNGQWINNDDPEKFGQLGNFNAKFDGSINTDKLPKGSLQIDATGRAGVVNFNKLNYVGEAGKFNSTGKLDTRSNFEWDVTAQLHQLDLSFFADNTSARITGDLATTGKWLPPKQSESLNQPTKVGIAQTIAQQLDDFSVTFDGNIDTDTLPTSRLALIAFGSGNNFVIDKLEHSGDSGKLNAHGKLDFTDGYKWQFNANMDKLNLAYFNSNLSSKLSGTINTDGFWQDDKQHIAIKQFDIDGNLKGETIKATGQLTANMHLPNHLPTYLKDLKSNNLQQQYKAVDGWIDTFDANNLQLEWGATLINANGSKSDLQTRVNIPNLAQISDKFNGKIIGNINFVQPNSATNQHSTPTLFVDMLASQVVVPNLVIDKGRITGKLVDFGKSSSQFLINATDVAIANKQFDTLKAVVNGTLPEHQANVSLTNQQLSFSTLLKGGYDKNNMVWQGIIGNGKLVANNTTLNQLQPAQLHLNMALANIDLAAHCWATATQQSNLCLKQNLQLSKNNGVVDIVIKQIDTHLLSIILPTNVMWDAKVSGDTKVSWHNKQPPNIHATLYSNNGKFGMVDDSNSVVSVPYKRISLIANSHENGLKLRTAIDSDNKGKAVADININPFSQPKPITGDLLLTDFDVAIFKPFFPSIRSLTGMANFNGKVSGTLKKPSFKGDASLKNGHLSIIGMPINLTNMELAAKLDGDLADIKGRFNSGEGVGNISGTIDWHNQLQAKLNLSGKNLLLSQPPLMTANINPDIDLIVKPASKYLNMQGVISVPSATFRPPEITEDIISKNADVLVLDRRISGNIDEILAISEPWSINSKIGIDLGNNVKFQGFGAELPLVGAVVISQQKQNAVTAKGLVQVSRSTNVNAFGQSLTLNYAQIRFDGSVQNPNLSIEADKQIEGKNVGLRVKGQLNDPVITVFNDAGLTEQQAMNALATGRISNQAATQVSEEGFRSEVSNNLAAAGISLGLSGTNNITNQIGRAFGLKSLTVSAAGNSDDTSVNVTGYITPDLYVRYGIGVFSAQSSLSARYQLTRRVYIEATSAVEGFIDVVYSWRF